jgi:hypothetical protein
MLICTQKIFCLIQYRFGYLINILCVSMLALRLTTKALLAKADALGAVVDEVLLDSFFATCCNTSIAEVVLTIFREEVLTRDFFDGGVKIRAVIKFFNSQLIIWVAIALRTLKGHSYF